MGQLWSKNELGGYMYSDNLSEEMRTAVQPGLRFRPFCDVKDPSQQHRHRGAIFHWNKFSDTEDEGGTIMETNVMPMTGFTVSQGTLVIKERGIGVPYTGLLDDLSEQPVKEIIHKTLKNNCKKTMDNAAAVEFAKTPLRVAPAGGSDTEAVTLTTNGATTVTNDIEMGKDHVKSIVDIMKERNIPAYTDDDYYCIAWPTTLRPFKNDLEGVKQYTETGFGHIMRGETGRYENCRFVEQTNVKKTAMSTAGSLWANGKSNWAFFFGNDTVAEAVAVPEEIRGKIAGDFGRDNGIAWYSLNGFGIVHTDSDQARIVMWDSAA